MKLSHRLNKIYYSNELHLLLFAFSSRLLENVVLHMRLVFYFYWVHAGLEAKYHSLLMSQSSNM